MTRLRTLQVQGFRNLHNIELSCNEGLNILYGDNGSGKSSVLESIHALSTGNSFRSARWESLIGHEESSALVVAGLATGSKVGIRRYRKRADGTDTIRLNGETERNWDRVAALLPVLALDATAFSLIEGGPSMRRRFLDWGVFHVEPAFLQNWRRVQRSLAQRNKLLKMNAERDASVEGWERELDSAAKTVDRYRASYLESLLPQIERVYGALAGERRLDLRLAYDRGWEAESELADLLRTGWGRDRRYGSTQNGPHRADIGVSVTGQRAVDVLSRGQLKLLVASLKVAQAELLQRDFNKDVVFLLDDLAAELDRTSLASVLDYLLNGDNQLFVTAIAKETLTDALPQTREFAAFHVKRGKISAAQER